MREYKRKAKIRRFIYSPIALFVLILLIAFMGKATWSVYTKEKESRKNLINATAELAALEARKDNITKQIERLKTPEGVEAEIRGQFQVAKPGERMVVIAEEKRVAKEEPEKQSYISKFFDFFR